ncbi:hypothetical protein [Corynebacterium efficiens YS-314]|uniref:Uncharacterized protein n=1 Tax=Corynebacterium efficiens (strain DSM 44549 / YS-314 / AJ 12310 / JCM 11189 / NBRC 100395) TaxID=196164 RepID=Q8FQE1_COREF|nr:hypothetical protein [Corynebacterium efficiens YS-314]
MTTGIILGTVGPGDAGLAKLGSDIPRGVGIEHRFRKPPVALQYRTGAGARND